MYDLNQAKRDFLTNCYARDGLVSLLHEMEMQYKLHKIIFTVFIIDVDYFKTFNDKYGHLCGDEVLKYFSSSIRLDLEAELNMVYRFGGDEFIVVFPEKTAGEALRLAERLRKNIRYRQYLYKGRRMKVTFSGGIASFPEDGKTVDLLLEHADQALYFSKKSGRGKTTTYGSIKQKKAFKVMLLALLLFLMALIFKYQNSVREIFSSLNQVKEVNIDLTRIFQNIHLPKINLHIRKESPTSKGLIAIHPSDPMAIWFSKNKGGVGSPAAAETDTVHLKSGRIVRGRIVNENDDEVKIEFKIPDGKATVSIHKADIVTIDRKGTA